MPSVKEQCEKLVKKLNTHADAWNVSGEEDRNSLINEKVIAFDSLAAARLIAALAEEVEEWRSNYASYLNDDGLEKMVAPSTARRATDTLLSEVNHA